MKEKEYKKFIEERDEKIVRLTIQVDYGILGKPNGWEIEKVVQRWFKDTPIYHSHASRDPCRIGKSERILGIKILTLEEYEKE